MAELNKSIASLKKKITAEEKKLQAFRDEVASLHAESDRCMAPARQKIETTITKLGEIVCNACQSPRFSASNKQLIRDTLFDAISVLGSPQFELPEWLVLNPPEPESLKKKLQNTVEANKSASDTTQETFDFFDEEKTNDSSEDEDPFGDYFEEFQRQEAEAQARTRKIFRGERLTVSEDEQRSLRALYLRLVTLVHPDLAPDDEDRLARNKLAAQINAAYKAGQLTVLLDIEEQVNRQQESEQRLARFKFFVDDIKHLEKTQTLLLQQLSRVKNDLKYLKKSGLGLAHKTLKSVFNHMKPSEKAALDESNQLCAPYDDLSEMLVKALDGTVNLETFRRWFFQTFQITQRNSRDNEEHEPMMEIFEEAVELFMKKNFKKARSGR